MRYTESYELIAQTPPEFYINKNASDVLDKEDCRLMLSCIASTLETGKPTKLTHLVYGSNGPLERTSRIVRKNKDTALIYGAP